MADQQPVRVYCPGYSTVPCPGHAWWYDEGGPGPKRQRCKVCATRVNWILPEHADRCAFCQEPLPPRHLGRPRVACDRDDCQAALRRLARTGEPPRPRSLACPTCGADIPVKPRGPVPAFCSRRCRYHAGQGYFTFARQREDVRRSVPHRTEP